MKINWKENENKKENKEKTKFTSCNLDNQVVENHKRTQQRVFAVLLPYLYKLHMVHATNNYSCPNVHVSSMSVLCIHHEIAM